MKIELILALIVVGGLITRFLWGSVTVTTLPSGEKEVTTSSGEGFTTLTSEEQSANYMGRKENIEGESITHYDTRITDDGEEIEIITEKPGKMTGFSILRKR